MGRVAGSMGDDERKGRGAAPGCGFEREGALPCCRFQREGETNIGKEMVEPAGS